MADPKRLMDRLGSGLERDLLIAGSEEQAPGLVRERVMANVLGVGVAAAAASTLAAATGGGGGKGGSALALLALKWLGIGALAGGVTALVGSELVSLRSAPSARPPEPAVAARAASPSEWPIPPPAPRAAELARPAAVAAEPSVRTEPRQPVGEVRIGTSSTTLEAESMRRIRSEAQHDPAFAERLLRQHLARFPNGAHAAEATRLLEKLSAGASSDPR
jgi:hypothetical protein